MSRMAFRLEKSDHGAEAELSAENRAIEESSCAGRILGSRRVVSRGLTGARCCRVSAIEWRFRVVVC
jgi:hypothetical protein